MDKRKNRQNYSMGLEDKPGQQFPEWEGWKSDTERALPVKISGGMTMFSFSFLIWTLTTQGCSFFETLRAVNV